jgi:hypothetical protein
VITLRIAAPIIAYLLQAKSTTLWQTRGPYIPVARPSIHRGAVTWKRSMKWSSSHASALAKLRKMNSDVLTGCAFPSDHFQIIRDLGNISALVAVLE